MVGSILTEDMIQNGKLLLQRLDDERVRVDAAFWIQLSEQGSWKLVFTYPAAEKVGVKAAYARIQKALSGMQLSKAISLEDVAIVKHDSDLVKLLRVAIRTGPGISGIRFTGNVVNGRLIPDTYIYRVN